MTDMTTREVAELLEVRVDYVRNSVRAVGIHTEWGKPTVWGEEEVEKLKELIEKRRRGDSEETRRKKSESQKGKKLSEETKKKISKAHKGKIVSEKTRELLRKAMKERKTPTMRDLFLKENPDFDGVFLEDIRDEIKYANVTPLYKFSKYIEYVNYKNQKIAYVEKSKKDEMISEIKKYCRSKPEGEVADFLSQYVEIERNTRSVIKPKELDIYIPSKKVGVEFNGLYWHSQYPKKYHFEKYQICKEKGIRCIQIFEDEWRDKKEIVKSILLSAIGVYERKVFARKCIVKEIDKKIANSFLDENHLNGSVKTAQKAFGLFLGEELLQVITVGKNRFAKDGKLELLRMASKLNTQVVGGFSKILKDSGIREIESYVDNRIYSGSGYESSGWKVIGSSGPSYFYTNKKVRKNRMSMMKSKLPGEGTEEQRANALGWYRVYDCGTTKLKYEV